MDFFDSSIFGKSLTRCKSTEPITSKLIHNHFREAGFPAGFCDDIKNGLPLLTHKTPPKTMTKNHISVYEHPEETKKILDKWKDMGVYRETEEEPWVVSPLGLTEKNGKLRLVLDAKESKLNEYILAPKFKLPSHSKVIKNLAYGDMLMKADFAATTTNKLRGTDIPRIHTSLYEQILCLPEFGIRIEISNIPFPNVLGSDKTLPGTNLGEGDGSVHRRLALLGKLSRSGQNNLQHIPRVVQILGNKAELR